MAGGIKNGDRRDIIDLATTHSAVAELSRKHKADRVNALSDNVAGARAKVVEPPTLSVRERVQALLELQGEYNYLDAKFFEERAALEVKCQKLYEELYTKRYEIVNEVVEFEGVTSEVMIDLKGVPNFWLSAMMANDTLATEITVRDEGTLKYLKDIKWTSIYNLNGFKLEFFFDTNAYFKNTVLPKMYLMIDEDEPIPERLIGMEIEWRPGKCLMERIQKKKPKKGSKSNKPLIKTETCESFFNFFNPPQAPKNDGDLDEDAAEELETLMEQDYEMGEVALRGEFYSKDDEDDYEDEED